MLSKLIDCIRKLNFIKDTKEKIRLTIQSKGVLIPSNTKFSDYPKLLRNKRFVYTFDNDVKKENS